MSYFCQLVWKLKEANRSIKLNDNKVSLQKLSFVGVLLPLHASLEKRRQEEGSVYRSDRFRCRELVKVFNKIKRMVSIKFNWHY